MARPGIAPKKLCTWAQRWSGQLSKLLAQVFVWNRIQLLRVKQLLQSLVKASKAGLDLLVVSAMDLLFGSRLLGERLARLLPR